MNTRKTTLIWKLAAVVTLGIALVHGVFGFLRVGREVEQLELEARRDHAAMAHALAVAATSTANRVGPSEARQLLEDADLKTDRADISWSPVTQPSPASSISRDFSAESITIRVDNHRTLVSTLSLPLANEPGVLEIREPLAAEQAYVETTIARTVVLTLILVLLCSAILLLVGRAFIQRPMQLILRKLERVARGDLSGPLELQQKDEFGLLAGALNSMCESLSRLQEENRKETHAKVAALEQLRHADRLSTVGQLSAGIAHELGTPLNVVSARAKMITRGKSKGEDAVEDAQVIVQQTERMTQIIRQLLDFARRRRPDSKQESLITLCEQVVRILEALARKSGVQLELEQTNQAVTVKVDAVQIEQVLTNLVMNAIQAQPDGGIVRLSVKKSSAPVPEAPDLEAEHAIVTVEDEGAGMDESTKQKVFEPFFTTKEIGQGTGLGLSVAYGIVHEHGGWIDVQTERGHGSRFMVHLPMSAQ